MIFCRLGKPCCFGLMVDLKPTGTGATMGTGTFNKFGVITFGTVLEDWLVLVEVSLLTDFRWFCCDGNHLFLEDAEAVK